MNHNFIYKLASNLIDKKSKLDKEQWIDDKNEKEKRIDQKMMELGITNDLTTHLEGLKNTIPWFIDQDKTLKEFWDMNHAYWREDVKIGRKGHDIFLIDWQGNVVQIRMKGLVI